MSYQLLTVLRGRQQPIVMHVTYSQRTGYSIHADHRLAPDHLQFVSFHWQAYMAA